MVGKLSCAILLSWLGAACAKGGNSDSADGMDATGGLSSGATGGLGPGATGGMSTASGSAAGSGGEGGEGSVGVSGPELAPGCSVFPGDNPWNQDVSTRPVHENSDAFIDSIGRGDHLHPDFGTVYEGAPIGIPFVLVDASASPVDISYDAYGDESDPGPFPIPLDAPIEGGVDSDGDRHVIAVDTDACILYELYRAFAEDGGFTAASGVSYDLSRNEHHPEGCTSADAAGLPIFPGLVRYDEVVLEGEIRHALRFTVSRSRRAYVFPARHYASSSDDENLPPMGLRLRMKEGYDCGAYSNEARVICTSLKRYGMLVADNGSDWYISGAPDPRWDDDALGDLKQIPGDAFEVVDMGEPFVTSAPDCSL